DSFFQREGLSSVRFTKGQPLQVPSRRLRPLLKLPAFAGLRLDLRPPEPCRRFPTGNRAMGDAPLLIPCQDQFECGFFRPVEIARGLQVRLPWSGVRLRRVHTCYLAKIREEIKEKNTLSRFVKA